MWNPTKNPFPRNCDASSWLFCKHNGDIGGGGEAGDDGDVDGGGEARDDGDMGNIIGYWLLMEANNVNVAAWIIRRPQDRFVRFPDVLIMD